MVLVPFTLSHANLILPLV